MILKIGQIWLGAVWKTFQSDLGCCWLLCSKEIGSPHANIYAKEMFIFYVGKRVGKNLCMFLLPCWLPTLAWSFLVISHLHANHDLWYLVNTAELLRLARFFSRRTAKFSYGEKKSLGMKKKRKPLGFLSPKIVKVTREADKEGKHLKQWGG